MYAATGMSSIVVGRFAGAVFDRTGNYRDAFMTFVALAIVAAIATRPSVSGIHKLHDVK